MTGLVSTGSLSLALGPAGRAMAQPMDGALLDGLQDHLNMERAASAAYFAMAIWSAERELKGFAHFLKSESRAEQEHAGRFADYLIARGQTVDLQDIAAPKQDWVSVEEIMAASFQMETDVTSSLQQLYIQSERVSDVRTTTFLDEVLVGQVASEHEFAHLLGRVRFAQGQPAAVLLIDQELSNGNHEPASLT